MLGLSTSMLSAVLPGSFSSLGSAGIRTKARVLNKESCLRDRHSEMKMMKTYFFTKMVTLIISSKSEFWLVSVLTSAQTNFLASEGRSCPKWIMYLGCTSGHLESDAIFNFYFLTASVLCLYCKSSLGPEIAAVLLRPWLLGYLPSLFLTSFWRIVTHL